MLIRIPPSGTCRESEVTTETVYRSRRRFIQGAALAGAAFGLPSLARTVGALSSRKARPSLRMGTPRSTTTSMSSAPTRVTRRAMPLS